MVNFSDIGNRALIIALVILGAVVGLAVLAALVPNIASSTSSMAENFTTADWGDPLANGISPIFGMVVSLLGLFMVVGLAFIIFRIRGGLGS